MHAGCAAEWTFLTGLEDTLDLLEGVGNTTVKLAFDTYHLGDSPEIVARLPNLVDQIATVHLGDAREPPSGEQDRCRIGDGILPLAEIVGALTAAGYNGYYEIELTGVEFEAADYGELIAHSRDAFHQLVTG
jgi:sugar phosphate isomerase/epimerase